METPQIEALAQSLIDLERQAKTLQTLIAQGVRNWAGQNPADALTQTAKAMLYDACKLQDINGAGEWSEAKKQFALSVLRG